MHLRRGGVVRAASLAVWVVAASFVVVVVVLFLALALTLTLISKTVVTPTLLAIRPRAMRRRHVSLLWFGTGIGSWGYYKVYSSPQRRDMTGGEARASPAIARRILIGLFASLKKKRGKGRGRSVTRQDGEQQQLDSVVCVAGPKSRLPELFCQAFIPLSD
jgi:hypothetical protein